MSALKRITASTFDADVLQAEGMVLVEFLTRWCPSCRALGPVLEALADEFAGRATIGQIDAEESPILSGQYGVQAVPTLLFFRGGVLVDEAVGAPPRRVLRERLEELAPSPAR